MKIIRSLIIVLVLILTHSLSGNCQNYNVPKITPQTYNPYPCNRSDYNNRVSRIYGSNSYNASYNQQVNAQKSYSNIPCRRPRVLIRVPVSNNYAVMTPPVTNTNPYFSRNQANPYFPR